MDIEKVFQYCPRCANKIELNHYFFVCDKCGLHQYLAPTPCNAAILINKKQEVMLVKRKNPPKKDYWDLPGGFIEFSETAEESLVRELQEELDFDIDSFSYFRSYTDIYNFKGVRVKTLGFIYVGTIDDESFSPKDDITEVRFFPLNAIPFPKIAFSSVKKAIKDFRATQ